MSCNKCHQQKCCCPPPPCYGCMEPEFVVIKPKCKPDPCGSLADAIWGIIGMGKPHCKIKFGIPSVIGSTVTIIALEGTGTLQYSKDGVIWQDSPTFTNMPTGINKYYVREMANPACAAAGFITVTSGSCVSSWQNNIPEDSECINGFINYRQSDGCGNERWKISGTACSSCVPNWNDVFPTVSECKEGTTHLKQDDGCGHTKLRDTGVACGTCVPLWVDVNPQLTQCIDNKIQIKTQNGCGLFDWRLTDSACGIVQCVFPTMTIDKVDPTCNGVLGATNANGKVRMSNYLNATKYQLCEDTEFSCIPNFATAIPIVGTAPIELWTNVAFLAGQQYKDYSVRIFGVNQACFVDSGLRFSNPCFDSRECTQPAYSGMVANPATCTGNVVNNNASMKLTNLTNTTKYGYSMGSVYSGPDFEGAVVIAGQQVFIVGLMGSVNPTPYTIRLFGDGDNCKSDVTIIVPGTDCAPDCGTLPAYVSKDAFEATCNGAAINNDAKISITGITNATRYGYALGSAYTGPAYALANIINGSDLLVDNIAGSAENTTYTFRFWSENEKCFTDVSQIVPGKICSTECATPVFTLQAIPPTCEGQTAKFDGQLKIVNHTGGTRFQICIDDSFSCGNNYEGAVPFSGSGPVVAFDQMTYFEAITVRVYASETCYETHTIFMDNPCASCCALKIKSVTLTNN